METLTFENITLDRLERIEKAAGDAGVYLDSTKLDNPLYGAEEVSFHSVKATVNYKRNTGEPNGTLSIVVLEVPHLFGVNLISPEYAAQKIQAFIESVQ